MKNSLLTALLFLLSFIVSNAQSQEELYAQARKYEQDHNYKDALPAYQKLLQLDSNNVNYLQYGSQVYTRYGYLIVEKEKDRADYYKTGAYLARKAIKINNNSAQAHLAYCLALGRINEKANNKSKIANAKIIKSEVDKTIELDSTLGAAYHILGKWHTIISSFTPKQQKIINKYYGGVPTGASYDAALKAFQKAIKLEPSLLLHKYEMANTYHKMKNDTEAKAWLAKALAVTPTTDDDKIYLEKAKELEKELK